MRSCSSVLDEQSRFNRAVISSIEALGSDILRHQNNVRLKRGMLANKLDAREFLCQIGLIVYGNIAAVLAARCNLTLGNWDRDESWAMPNDAYTLVRGHTEPFLHHVLSDPSAVLGASYEAVLEYEPYVDHK